METVLELIAKERQRQIEKEGWTAEHDRGHSDGSIAQAAACYALGNKKAKGVRFKSCGCREAMCGHNNYYPFEVEIPFPWDKEFDKRKKHDRIKQLCIAGALIAAEIDRLQVLATPVK